jgi:hypothetical protein
MQQIATQITKIYAINFNPVQAEHQPAANLSILLQKSAVKATPAALNETRHILANSWDGDEAHMQAAKDEVRTICNRHSYPVPKNLPAQIRKWYMRAKTEGAVNTHYHLAGHPEKISQEQVQFCLDELLGYKSHGRADPYPSIEVLAESRPAVQQVLDDTGINMKTLVDRMKQLCPGLRRVRLRAMKQLTPKVKENRLKRCRELVRYTDAELQRIVWVDSKSMPMLVSNEWGWLDTHSEEATLVLKRAQTRKAKSIMLNYYIAVCGLAGAVLLYYYTGTTGLGPTREDVAFKVSVTAGSGAGAFLQ